MPSVRDDDLQVLVVGAGIGGLSLARSLQEAGLEPVVVERREEVGHRSGVVELWPQTVQLLARLGVAEDVREASARVQTWSLRESDGSVGTRLTAEEGGYLVVRYGRLCELLEAAVTDGVVRTGTALESLEASTGTVTATFESGISEQFDVVVGADGAGSHTRNFLGGGTSAFRATTTWVFPLNGAPSGASELWADGGAVLRTLPTGDGQVGVLTASTETEPDDPADVQQLAPDVEWLPPDAFANGREVSTLADRRVTADVWADGRVALLGDAAHARHPLAGVGPTLAIEDATLLASDLVRSGGSLSTRLADYASARRAHFRRIVQESSCPSPFAAVDSPLAERYPAIPRLRGRQLWSCF